MHQYDPVLVELTRGEQVESRHRGHAAVVDADGRTVAVWGDADRPVYPRSTVKPLQILPLIETGAAERCAVGDEEIALGCASHSGEPDQVRRIGEWLARLGLSADALVCGPHPPLSEDAAVALIRRGERPTRLHNNCAGKHAAFITTALHLREPIMGYAGPVHPVQLRVKRVLSQMAGVALDDTVRGVDGCGVPTLALPLTGLATAVARLAAPDRLGRLRADAARRVIAVMTAHPHLVGGRGRFDSEVMAAADGALLVKGGAEGVHVAALPERGLGIAVKIEDGAKRAAEPAMAALLARFAEPGATLAQTLAGYAEGDLRNTTGARVGSIRVVAELLTP